MAEQDDDEFELGDLRSVFSSMREAEEDPPETGMAALMAAARMKATEMKPPRSLWERIFGVMRTPPVLAFATVVVLVGGGAVMFRHRAEMKETVHVAAPSSGRAVPARETVRSDEPPQEQTAPVELAVPEAELGTAPPMAPSGRRRVLTRKQTKALNDEIDRVAKDAMLDIDVDSLAGKKTSGGELDAMAPSNGPGIGGPPLPKVSTTTLVTRWESAAVAKNCALANSLGAQLAERDQALYMRTFQKNQSLQDCFNSKP